MAYTPLQHLTADRTAPAFDAAVVTPSDSTDIPVTRGLYIGTTGNLTVITAAGNTVPWVAVPAGQILPIQVTRVKATGTTASNIVAMY